MTRRMQALENCPILPSSSAFAPARSAHSRQDFLWDDGPLLFVFCKQPFVVFENMSLRAFGSPVACIQNLASHIQSAR